jgi:hypothetical protein
VPDYLVRSSYRALSTTAFTATGAGGASVMNLVAVEDLAGDAKLAGSDDAFALELSASRPVEQGIYSFAHPDLGAFDLFMAPAGGRGTYEVVVNRSVGAPRHPPKPASPAASGPSAQPSPGPSAQPPAKPPAHKLPKPRVRRISVRRVRNAVVCDLTLSDPAHVKSATVWLSRDNRVVAGTTLAHLHGRQRVAVRLPFSKRPRGGRYEVVVATTDRHGTIEYERSSLTLL